MRIEPSSESSGEVYRSLRVEGDSRTALRVLVRVVGVGGGMNMDCSVGLGFRRRAMVGICSDTKKMCVYFNLRMVKLRLRRLVLPLVVGATTSASARASRNVC